jgi:hypothetical protein
LQQIAVIFHETGSEESYIQSFDNELVVFLPDKAHWYRDDICSPLSVTGVLGWVTFMLDEEICSAGSEWFVNLAENHMRLDVLAEVLKISVDELLAMKFVSSDDKEHSAICNRNWADSLTSSSLVDIRPVLAVLAMTCPGIESKTARTTPDCTARTSANLAQAEGI